MQAHCSSIPPPTQEQRSSRKRPSPAAGSPCLTRSPSSSSCSSAASSVDRASPRFRPEPTRRRTVSPAPASAMPHPTQSQAGPSTSTLAPRSSAYLRPTGSETTLDSPFLSSSQVQAAAAHAAQSKCHLDLQEHRARIFKSLAERQSYQPQFRDSSSKYLAINPLLLEPVYSDEVVAYMAEMEGKTMASVELIDQQPELEWYMRPYLVDFLIEIHQQYRLKPETLYLAVNIVDRYVSKRIVYKKHYQLVGCAALWIAAKFEDQKDKVPSVEDLVAVCCQAYDQYAFIQMEGHVLSTIEWNLGHPSAEAWLRAETLGRSNPLKEDEPALAVARFLMEITLFHRAFVAAKPSDVARGCLLLAKSMWSASYVQPVEGDIVVKIATMLDQHCASSLEQISHTVVKKYGSMTTFFGASTYVRLWYLAGQRFAYKPNTSVSLPAQVSSDIPDIDMTPSSPSPSSAGDQEPDCTFSDEELLGVSSAPLTPATSVSSYFSDRCAPSSVPSIQIQVTKPPPAVVVHPSIKDGSWPSSDDVFRVPVAVPAPHRAQAPAPVYH